MKRRSLLIYLAPLLAIFGTCAKSDGNPELAKEMGTLIRDAGEGRSSPEIQAAQARVEKELTAGELSYLAAVAWHKLPAEVALQDPVFRRAMAAAAEPQRKGPKVNKDGVASSSQALSGKDLVDWVKSNARIFAAAGTLAVGAVACAASFTGVGAVACAAAIAFVASAVLPAHAGEPGFDDLPQPDQPADVDAYKKHVDPQYSCPVGYKICSPEQYCSNLASVYRHCGRCGNRCASGKCVAGKCGQPTLDAGAAAPTCDGGTGTSCTAVDDKSGPMMVKCKNGVQITLLHGTPGAPGADGKCGQKGSPGSPGGAPEGLDQLGCTDCAQTTGSDGAITVKCTDGTSVTVLPGIPGDNGADGPACG